MGIIIIPALIVILVLELFLFRKVTGFGSGIMDYTPQQLFKNWNPQRFNFKFITFIFILILGYLGKAYFSMKFPFNPYISDTSDGKVYLEAYLSGLAIISSLLLGWFVFSGMSQLLNTKKNFLKNFFNKISGLLLFGVFLTSAYYLTLLLFFGITFK